MPPRKQTAHRTISEFRYTARPIHLTTLVPLWRQSEECADIGCLVEPVRVVDQVDEAELVDRPDARNGHEASSDGVGLGLFLYGFVEIVCRLTQRVVGGDKPVGDGAQHRVGFPGHRELITKRLTLPTLVDACHADVEGFQHAPDVAFEVFAQTDQSLSRTNQAAQPIGPFAALRANGFYTQTKDRCSVVAPAEIQ